MHAPRLVSLVLGAALVSGCSVWQNASRKYLDKSAYDLAGIKVRESLVGCAEPVADASWQDGGGDDRSRWLEREAAGTYELRVETRDHAYACDYRFASADERRDLAPRAVSLALDHRP